MPPIRSSARRANVARLSTMPPIRSSPRLANVARHADDGAVCLVLRARRNGGITPEIKNLMIYLLTEAVARGVNLLARDVYYGEHHLILSNNGEYPFEKFKGYFNILKREIKEKYAATSTTAVFSVEHAPLPRDAAADNSAIAPPEPQLGSSSSNINNSNNNTGSRGIIAVATHPATTTTPEPSAGDVAAFPSDERSEGNEGTSAAGLSVERAPLPRDAAADNSAIAPPEPQLGSSSSNINNSNNNTGSRGIIAVATHPATTTTPEPSAGDVAAFPFDERSV
jgi:hypothetical protein